MAMAASSPHKFGDLIPFKLDLSSNYVIWKYAMATLLQAFNLYGYVDGTSENDNGDDGAHKNEDNCSI
ncbi:putative gag-polypeptide of LTR copia-type [Rosa chinensis]|uniref:Putative gag-polypeptide of LTR copia-type n=1 Tax=Rosa chinensis TaxID=74649 RepID=A0A2P6QAP0_ROSCH|nr:putative gag-polypeptide of LTR copia-type [Rosa chinensis]